MYTLSVIIMGVASVLLHSPEEMDAKVQKYEKEYEQEYQTDLQQRMEKDEEPAIAETAAKEAAPKEPVEKTAARQPSIDEIMDRVKAAKAAGMSDEEIAAKAREYQSHGLVDLPAGLPEGDSSEDAGPAGGSEDEEHSAPPDVDEEKAKVDWTAAHVTNLMDGAMEKLKGSAKTLVMLHVLMKPVATKLHLAMAKMTDEEKARAQHLVDHLDSLDALSEQSVGLLAGVEAVEHAHGPEKAASLAALIEAMNAIQAKVKTHLLALKNPEETAAMGGQPAAHAHHGMRERLTSLTQKMNQNLQHLQARVDSELADPAKKDDPMVKMDMEVLDTMKGAVKKAEALIVVASVALQKAKDPEERAKVKTAVKEELHTVLANLKENMGNLKEKSVMVAALSALKKAKKFKQDQLEKAKQMKEEQAQEKARAKDYGEEDADADHDSADADLAAILHGAPAAEDQESLPKGDHDVDMKDLLSQLDTLKHSIRKPAKDEANLRSMP